MFGTGKVQRDAVQHSLVVNGIDVYQGVANIRIFEYIRIFSDTNIRSYHIRIIFLIQIYSDIRSQLKAGQVELVFNK